MDMFIEYTFENEKRTIVVTMPDATNRAKPLILLLHGLLGNTKNMSNPEDQAHIYDGNARLPADSDQGWASTPGIGLYSIDIDPQKKDVTGWKPFLEAHGFRTAVYDQVDSGGFLARPIQELAVVAERLLQKKADLPPLQEEADLPAKVVILAHSRGGLLARAFLKNTSSSPAAAAFIARVSQVITLHSPHLGTNLANVGAAVEAAIDTLGVGHSMDTVNALKSFRDQVKSQAIQELRVGSTFLGQLSNGETALPGVEYHTFGGTRVSYARVLAWTYTPASAVPHIRLQNGSLTTQFHHVITPTLAPVLSPIFDSLPDLTEEITPGRGDMLSADSRDHLPFSIRHTNALNHAEALWDPNLQRQVLGLLRELRLRISVTPAAIVAGRTATITVHAEDAYDRMRQQGDVYVAEALAGRTDIPFDVTLHQPSMAVVRVPGYPDAPFDLPVVLGTMRISVAPAPMPLGTPAQITINVSDATTGLPIPQAVVHIENPGQLRTDPQEPPEGHPCNRPFEYTFRPRISRAFNHASGEYITTMRYPTAYVDAADYRRVEVDWSFLPVEVVVG